MTAEAATPPRLEIGDTPVCRLRTLLPMIQNFGRVFGSAHPLSRRTGLLDKALSGTQMHHHIGAAAQRC